MKKAFFILLSMMLSISVIAQQQIQLRSVDKAECVKSDMTSLKASFSFSTIEAQDYESERGTFSWLSLPNTVIGGNEGDPQIPVVNELIAVPFGANPRIEITSYSTTDYRLEDYGMKTLVPRQPSLRKDKNPDEVPFVYNASAYQSTRGFRSEPMATVNVMGTMRGVQLGKMTIEPVSYDPVNNTMRVFNDIEVTVHFDGANAVATEKMLVDTYSPYFDIVYKQLFNERAVRDAYSDHPDLYNTPVKMLVVATSAYQSSTAFQNWLTWKKQKGIDVDIYTVTSSTASSTIQSEIYSRYNANHPTFLVIVGDETVVKAYKTNWSCGSNYGNCINDLEYASVDGDVYHDMFMSRMSVSSTTELGNLVNKILTYEKYTMSTPSYLNNSLLVAGWDSNWTPKVGKPTIQYANNNYYNSAHGINPTVYITTASGQTAAYNNINNVGFLNYTAHGDIQELADPEFTNSNTNSMTNNDKYLWVVANCCLTANWGNSSYSPCLGETMIRAANKGAFGYIGSIPESYWYEDYYFGVGAFSYVAGTVQTPSSTTTGMYDAAFDDTGFNTLNSMPYIGNVAVTYAHAAGYTSSVTDEYYWRAYQCLGDGSVMPYLNNPSANSVSHTGVLPIGANSYTVSADAGSYVSITVNNEIIGVAAVPNNSTSVSVPVTAQSAPGTAMIVVTRNQRQPYIGTINIVGGTQYNITVNQPQHGTLSAPTQAYAQATVTLSATPETGYCLSSWDVRDASNNSITVTNNQFTMPESNVTVTATFVPGMAVTLASVMNGSINADLLYALQGNTVNLTATPASGYSLESWVVFKTGDVSTTITVTDNSFTMPNYPVTVSAIFSKPAINDVTIGSGTGTDAGSDIPTDVYYKYSLSQQIYTASELGSAGNITKISFYYNSSTASGSRTLAIYMSHTTSSTLSSWVTQSSSNLVYSGSHNFTQGWNTITLTTPFAYNGTNNLLLTVDDNTGSYSVNQFIYFYTYSTGANRAIYYRNDNNNPSATSSNSYSATKVQYNAQMKVTKEVQNTEGYLSVSPITLSDFQAVAGGAPSDPQSIAIVGNNLQANLTVTAPTGYEVCATQNGTYNSTLTLTPTNGSLRANVFVRLGTNTNPGEYIGNLTLASGTATATVSLNGTVIPGNVQYTVTLMANPSAGGNVTGAGEFNYNTPITVTATANEGYTFTNWTKNGEVVSTNSSYSFNVTGATDLVANFTISSYSVTAIPNPVEGGSVTFSGNFNVNQFVYDFEDGTLQGWTVLQGPNSDSPNNWMHCTAYTMFDFASGHGHNSNGFMLSESFIYDSPDSGDGVNPDNYLVSPNIPLGGSITFWATNVDDGFGAEHFSVAVSTNGNTDVDDFMDVEEWTLLAEKTGVTRNINNGTWYEYTVDLSSFSGLGYVAIHHFNCRDQWILCVDDITITEGHSFNHGESCTLIATANEGYDFVNWTENGQEVANSASYSFVVTGERNLVANFEASTPTMQQSITLAEGWNWWAPNIDITLADLEAALGNNGIRIVSQDDNTAFYSSNGWGGDLTTIEVGKMYMLQTSSACTINVSGTVVNPEEHPVMLYPGSNWIGFIGTEAMSIEDAFQNLTPTNMDIIKTQTGTAVYYQGRGWRGNVSILNLGEGFIYTSKASTIQQFTYPSEE